MKPIYRKILAGALAGALTASIQAAEGRPGPAAGLESLKAMEGRIVSAIRIEAGLSTRPEVILRELETQVGRPLDLNALRGDLIRIENLSIFSSVRVQGDSGTHEVALSFQCRELPPVIPYVGFSITDETGLSLGPAAASPNLFGRDITASASLLVGGATQFRMVLDYPWIFTPRTDLYFDAALRERNDDVREFKETSLELAPTMSWWLGKRLSLLAGASYFLMDADTNRVTLSPSGVDHLYTLSMGLEWDGRNSYRSPTQGWQFLFNSSMTFSPHGNFSGIGVDVRRYISLAPKHSLALGGLWNQRFSKVPDYLQFAMGGANSIRGYHVDVLGKELRGKNELIATLEYRFMLIPIQEFKVFKWGLNLGLAGAVFLDSGTAWNRREDLDFRRFRTGVGTGLRVLVPATEMIRLEGAVGRNGRFEFYIRGGSKFEMQKKRLR